MLKVDIDPNSGFCAGVIRAISKAEDSLSKEGGKIYSLGAIVHNDAELERLSIKGLVTIDKEDLDEIYDAGGERLLIRAHGEPPATYDTARAKGFRIIDCTCPVVLKLQKSIRETWQKTHLLGNGGQVLIFGKNGHAEVLGLAGQIGGDAIIVEDINGLAEAVREGRLLLNRPVELFSQTTKNPVEYRELCNWLQEMMMKANSISAENFAGSGMLTVHDTICSQVASRHSKLARFASSHSIIIFVSGKASSNGKVLCDLCKSCNIRTYHIDSEEELREAWFRPDDNVGVCGATSTPKWLLEKVARRIEALL